MSAVRLTLFALAALALHAAAQPAGPPDRVVYRDRKDNQTRTVEGEVRESVAGVQVFGGGRLKLAVSPADVLAVEYGTLPGLPAADRDAAFGFDRKRDADPVKARDWFAAAKKAAADPKTRRYLEFKEGVWSARAADTKAGADFTAEAKAAADKLLAFARAVQSWEAYPAYRTAARLLTDAGLYPDAVAALASLGRVKDLPRELVYEARLAEAEAQLRAGNRVAAEAVADALGRDKDLPPSGPLREKVRILQAVVKAPPPKPAADGSEPVKPTAAAKAIESEIGAAKDPAARAFGKNLLGRLYLAQGLPRDAMWEFFWVETVFHQDRDEVREGLASLAEAFDRLGNKEQADQYREKLKQAKADWR